MDHMELVATALTAGAVASKEPTAPPKMRVAYERLRKLVLERFSGVESVLEDLDQDAAGPQTWRWTLELVLVRMRPDAGIGTDVIEAAVSLMELIACGDRYTASQDKPPATSASAADMAVPVLPPVSQPTSEPKPNTAGSVPMLPRVRAAGRAAARATMNVVLIDGCSGVQYGQDNVQYSVYRASLPSVALVSSEALARHLLGEGSQWARDVFTHNGQASFAGLAGAGSSFSGVSEAAAGDTLVIIRNSRGVQVGDGNTQHNEFQIRIANVAIKVIQVSQTSASQAAIDRLCRNPSHAAAEALAKLIAETAREHLVLDLTAQATQEVGSPVISGQPAEIRGRTGVQAAGSAQAHVDVKVEVTHVNVDRLADLLLAQAQRIFASAEPAAETGQLADFGSDRGIRHPRTAQTNPGDALAALVADAESRREAARTARYLRYGLGRGPMGPRR
jgi:hypothetical protein